MEGALSGMAARGLIRHNPHNSMSSTPEAPMSTFDRDETQSGTSTIPVTSRLSPQAASLAVVLVIAALVGCAGGPSTVPFDLVLRGGTVMGPESGLNAVRDVGVRDGRIEAKASSAGIRPAPIFGRVLESRSNCRLRPVVRGWT